MFLGVTTPTFAGTIVANPNTIDTDQTGNNAFGVKESTANANSGVVEIQTGGIIDEVYGGASLNGTANDNTVTISGGTVRSIVYSGRTTYADANNNTATVSDGTVDNDVNGGGSSSGTASNNTATVSGGTVNNVYSGSSYSGDAIENTATVSDGTVKYSVIGGYSSEGNATDNTATVLGGTVGDVKGGSSSSGTASNNTATVSGGTVKYGVYGAHSYSKANVTGNTATVSGGTVTYGVYGGYSSEGNASDNKATISGGTVALQVYGGWSAGNATGNTATVSDGTVNHHVHGGHSSEGDATDNTATISGGTVKGHVIGGQSGEGNATNNTVSIKKGSGGNPTFGTNTVLYGGFDWDTSTPNDVKTGNTLNMHTTGITVRNIKNFENLHFYVQDDTAAGATFLTLSDSAGTTITDTNIGICVPKGISSSLAIGDTLTLVGAKSLSTDATLSNNTTKMDDCSDAYAFSLEKVGNNLVAKVTVPKFSIGGEVSGLDETANGEDYGETYFFLINYDQIATMTYIHKNGTFKLNTAFKDKEKYDVKPPYGAEVIAWVSITPPSGGAAYSYAHQKCVITNNSGQVNAANVENINIDCSEYLKFAIGGDVSGLNGTVVLQNGSHSKSVSGNGTVNFAFDPVRNGDYNVTVKTHPAGQHCQATNDGTGKLRGRDINWVKVTCSNKLYSIGGKVSDLNGTLKLKNGSETINVTSNAFTFANKVAHNGGYDVSIVGQPKGQKCTISHAKDTVNAANVTNIQVTCSNKFYSIGGTVSGLNGTLKLKNGSETINVTTSSFTFANKVAHNGGYDVSIVGQPAGQKCTISHAKDTVNAANVTNIQVKCSSYKVGRIFADSFEK